MILPIGDENPPVHQPVTNWVLIGANVLVFFATLSATGLHPSEWSMQTLALRPDAVEPWQLLTSMFMHGGLAHIIGNMLFLWIVGDNVEDVMGRAWYGVFFLGCGLAAGLAHLALHAGSSVPVIGASGAVAGVLGAYVVLFPRHEIKLLYFFGFWWYGVWYVSAKWAIGVWFGQQILFFFLLEKVGAGGTAFLAHIGGFAAGAAVAFALRDKLLSRLTEAPRRPPKRRVLDAEFTPIPDGLDAAGAPVYGGAPRTRARVRSTWSPGGGGWRVLATSEDPLDVPAAGRAVAEVTHRPLADCTQAVADGGGFLLRDTDEASARLAVQALHRAGIAATARPETELRPLPELVEVPRALFGDDGFECDTAGGFVRVRYAEVALLVVGLVARGDAAGRPAQVLTVFLHGGPRLLFVEGMCVAKLARQRFGVSTGLPVRGVVVRLLNHAPSAGRNRGAAALAGGASQRDWTGLTFDGFGAYEAYTAWLWNIRGR